MKNPVFTGAGVAIITPMYEDGSINFDELGRIVEDQIARGTDAIVICGTTGECSTMTDEEQLAAIKYTVDLVNHRVPVIAGAGSNDTDHGCALAAKSAACGADALLLVTPYYNKTSQAGLVAHFTAMAEAGGIPVILYNVPSRTGLNIAPETAKELSKHPLINGIKEASGNIGQVAKIAALCGDELNIYSGNDDQVVPLLSLGGKGVISVVSNVKPALVHNCCKAWSVSYTHLDVYKRQTLDCAGCQLTDALYPAETGRTILDEQRVDGVGLFQRIPHFIGVALRLERKELFARLLAHAPFRCPGNDLVQLQRFQITCFHSNSLY